MAKTIADAIDDSKQQFTKRYRRETMPAMAKKYPLTSSVEILRRLVDQAGGPEKFAKKYSIGDPDNPINPTYVSQILNGNRPFRDTARAQMAKRAGLPETYFEAASPSVQQPLVEYKATPELSKEARAVALYYDKLPANLRGEFQKALITTILQNRFQIPDVNVNYVTEVLNIFNPV